MIVPEKYGFKSVKWLNNIQVTSSHLNNDTYADKGNDVDSLMKSYARIVFWNETAETGQPLPLTGVAQSGSSGLSKVQYWLQPKSEPWPDDDPYFTKAPWKEAEILPPPSNDWGDFPKGKTLPTIPYQIADTGKPVSWPLRNSTAHFAALLPSVEKGNYELRVRAIDANGLAQPMPRPFRKSGGNTIQKKPLTVGG